MFNLDKIYVSIKGVTPLIIHNGRLGNPLDPHARMLKSLSSKRNKTDDDLQQLLEVQWEGSLYWSDKIGLYMPSENLFASFLKAAKKHKLGTKTGGVSFPDPLGYPIITENHTDFKAMKENPMNKFDKMVVIQKTTRTLFRRPIFNNWRIDYELEFEKDVIDANEIRTLILTQSARIGLGVWTPSHPKPGSYGKFVIEKLEWHDTKGNVKIISGV